MLVKGATCYADVRTYNGTVHETFKDACAARDLLGEDTEWYCAFYEALTWGMGNQLRRLFVTILILCGVIDEKAFFEKYWLFMTEDRSEEHTSELQSHYSISYAVFCLKKIFF